LLSAAKAHSRLHQAAVIALRSITAVKATQQQADGMLQYLEKHGQHLDSISISGDRGCTITLPLPGNLQLNTIHSVQLDRVGLHPCLQLQPGHGLLGMLGPPAGVAALTQLRLSDCKLRDTAAADALASAFWQLPQEMQHLSIKSGTVRFRIPAGVCQQLQQLTHLELVCIDVVGPDGTSSKLQDLPSLERLVDLQLHAVWQVDIPGDMLSGMRHLTRLELPFSKSVDLNVLDGRTQLRHFTLGQRVSGVQEAQVLSHLQHMQHLTYLDLSNCMWSQEDGNPPAAAYSALTASSKLVHLDIGYCTLPAGVWQHIFPAGRQLPHLQFLYITDMRLPAGDEGIPPTGSTLVSCCPSLQVLDISGLQYSAELLATLHRLTELTGLSTLYLGNYDYYGEGLEVVSQLTGLRELFLHFPSSSQHRLLLQLTQLKQLTSLDFEGCGGSTCRTVHLTVQVRCPFYDAYD
jgi:hypothetical protein